MINEGSTNAYCCEDPSLILNYYKAIADTTQTWDCHHRAEVLPCGRFSRNDLKKFGLYYKRPAAELIFLTSSAHCQLHKKGVPKSEAHKKAISDAKKGVMIGPMSEATKKAISDCLKGHLVSEATKNAISEAHSKEVLQFTKSREFIKKWPSAKEASHNLGIAHSNICRSCNGKRKYAGGYVWKYT